MKSQLKFSCDGKTSTLSANLYFKGLNCLDADHGDWDMTALKRRHYLNHNRQQNKWIAPTYGKWSGNTSYTYSQEQWSVEKLYPMHIGHSEFLRFLPYHITYLNLKMALRWLRRNGQQPTVMLKWRRSSVESPIQVYGDRDLFRHHTASRCRKAKESFWHIQALWIGGGGHTCSDSFPDWKTESTDLQHLERLQHRWKVLPGMTIR